MPWDVTKAVEHLQKFAHEKSTGRCARYVREAIEAGGVVLARKNSAKDYGMSLMAVGFKERASSSVSTFSVGDIVIFEASEGHPHGHMEMYDGKQWISDFKQKGINPYKKGKPAYRVYRYQGVDASNTMSPSATAFA